jgi:hypothetical protein
VLLTRTPLNALLRPLDLHVLGTPPTFVLSQDQTRQLIWPDFRRSRFAIGFAIANLFFHPARTFFEPKPEERFCFLLPDDSTLPGFIVIPLFSFQRILPDAEASNRVPRPRRVSVSGGAPSSWEGGYTGSHGRGSTTLCALRALFSALSPPRIRFTTAFYRVFRYLP